MSHERYESYIEACHDCAIACEHCATECLKESDVKMMARCIALDRSCADICVMAEREMARGSEVVVEVCRLCAEICQRCGDECAKHKMEHCQECAGACHACAEECRAMSGSTAGAM